MTALLDRPQLDEGTQSSAPSIKPGGRIHGIDIARGIALLGMMTVHVFITGDQEPTGITAWLLQAPSGQASVLFFVLSGVSLSVIAGRGSASADPAVLRRRGVILLLLGLLLSATAWSASILEHYGVMFLLAPWLLRLSRRSLAIVAAFGMVLGPTVLLVLEGQTPFLGHGGVTWPASVVSSLWIDGTYPLIVWVGFFALGIILGRLDLRSSKTAAQLLATGLIGVALVTAGLFGLSRAGIESPREKIFDESPASFSEDGDGSFITEEEFKRLKESGELTFTDDEFEKKFDKDFEVDRNPRQLLSTGSHSNEIGWTLRASSIAVAILGVTLLLPGAIQRVFTPLASLGSISLTAYLLHIPFVTDGWDWIVGQESTMSTNGQIGVLLAMEAALLTIGWLIVKTMGMGPAERLLKSLSR